jgi:hypothetical protein
LKQGNADSKKQNALYYYQFDFTNYTKSLINIKYIGSPSDHNSTAKGASHVPEVKSNQGGHNTAGEKQQSGSDERYYRDNSGWEILTISNDTIIESAQLYHPANIIHADSRHGDGKADSIQKSHENSLLDQIKQHLREDQESDLEITEEMVDKTETVEPTEVDEEFYEDDEDDSGRYERNQTCSHIQRSAMLFQSSLSYHEIFHLLSSWKLFDLLFMTRSNQVSFYISLYGFY